MTTKQAIKPAMARIRSTGLGVFVADVSGFMDVYFLLDLSGKKPDTRRICWFDVAQQFALPASVGNNHICPVHVLLGIFVDIRIGKLYTSILSA